jgi:LemA protein
MEPIIIIVLVIVGVLLIWLATGYNSLQSGKIKVEEAESGIDVALTKRFDVLTKMVETVKGYAKHEKETLEKVIEMRNSVNLRNASIGDKQEITKSMDQAMRAINVVVEQYPDLKANENFKQLQLSISDVEEHLQAARRVYNANVSSYNQKVQMFPSNILAGLFHFTTKEFFEAEDFKRNDVEIKF